VDAWTVLTGASAGIVAGFAVDLFRLGLHEARRALASVGAMHRSPHPPKHGRCGRSCG
jgi:hypothetical protein